MEMKSRPHKWRACVRCGTEYFVLTPTQRYCCRDCYHAAVVHGELKKERGLQDADWTNEDKNPKGSGCPF